MTSSDDDETAGIDPPATPPEQTFAWPPNRVSVATRPPPVRRPNVMGAANGAAAGAANGAAAGPVPQQAPPPPPAPAPMVMPPAPLPPMQPLPMPQLPMQFAQFPFGIPPPPQPIQPNPFFNLMQNINPQNLLMNPFAYVTDDTDEYDSDATSIASGDGFKYKHLKRRQI